MKSEEFCEIDTASNEHLFGSIYRQYGRKQTTHVRLLSKYVRNGLAWLDGTQHLVMIPLTYGDRCFATISSKRLDLMYQSMKRQFTQWL